MIKVKKMINLKINDIPVTVPEGTSILQAAKAANIEIPSLCYLTASAHAVSAWSRSEAEEV